MCSSDLARMELRARCEPALAPGETIVWPHLGDDYNDERLSLIRQHLRENGYAQFPSFAVAAPDADENGGANGGEVVAGAEGTASKPPPTSSYDLLRERGGALVASGAAPPVQLTLRGDLVTRLGWGLVYRVHVLSDAEKLGALTEHAAARGFPLLPEVGEYLLAHVRRDLPSLLAVLDALDRYSRETKRPVTVPLVRDLVRTAGAQAGSVNEGVGLD